MKYAKLINNSIEYAPRNKDGVINYNLDIDLMLADGYKPVVQVEIPLTNRMFHIGYIENRDNITEVIVYDETQKEADKRAEKEEEERMLLLSLTKREVFLALFHDKELTPEQLRAQITDPEALIEFDYAERYYRGNPLINEIGAMLGYSKEDLDYLFVNKELPQ